MRINLKINSAFYYSGNCWLAVRQAVTFWAVILAGQTADGLLSRCGRA